MTGPSLPQAATRRAWHGVAELVLAGPQYRRTGTIRLRVAPGGFATTKQPELRVEGVDLVASHSRVGIAGRTCADVATAVAVDVGAPEGLYHDGSGVKADEVLLLDEVAAARLAECFAIGDAALRELAPTEQPNLWPEHFDVSVTLLEVTYGVSLGDGYLDEPYAYVGPWQSREGPFWNAPFGAARTIRELGDVDGVVGLFTEGRGLTRG